MKPSRIFTALMLIVFMVTGILVTISAIKDGDIYHTLIGLIATFVCFSKLFYDNFSTIKTFLGLWFTTDMTFIEVITWMWRNRK